VGRKLNAIVVVAVLFLLARTGKAAKRSGPGPKKTASRGLRIPPKPEAAIWSDDEMRVFGKAVDSTGVPVPVVLEVYTAESGLDPHASSGVAWGLPQAIAGTLKDLGWWGTPESFGNLSVSEQAPWIAKLLKAQIKAIGYVPKNPLDLYVASLSPRAARQHADILYSRDSTFPEDRQAYEANVGLDRAAKGHIDRADLSFVLGKVESSGLYHNAVAHWERVQS